MSIFQVDEKRGSPSLTMTANGRNATREWWAYSNDVNDGPLYVLSHMGVAEIGFSYSHGFDYDPYMKCSNISISREEILDKSGTTVYRWDVKAEYGTPDSGSNNQQQQDPNPLNRPVEVGGGSALVETTTQIDRDGNPIVNTAGESFPPVRITKSELELEFVRNESTSPKTKAKDYTGKLNSASIWDEDAEKWRCMAITWKKIYENEYTYYQTTYRFRLDDDKHKTKLISNGYNEVVGGALVPIKLANGEKPTEPQPLDSGGNAVEDLDLAEQMEFDHYKTANFSTLGLPTVV